MSDPTPTVTNVASEIDRMVSISGRRHEVTVQGSPGKLQVHAEHDETGKLVSKVTVHQAPTTSTGEAARIHDNDVNIPFEVSQLQAKLQAAEAKFNGTNGYDRVTGQPVPLIPEEHRAAALKQLQQTRTSVAYQLQTYAKLQAQRDSDASHTSAADQERALSETYTRGDPSRATRLKAALADAEASEVAAAIVAARRGGRR